MQADLYPSRISDKPSITKRKDPVVYTNSDDLNTLSKEQAESFEKNGYLLMPKFFSDEEVEVLKEELQRVMNEHRHSNDDEVIREPDSEDIRSVFDVHKRSEFFQKLSRHERIVHIVQDLLGSQAYIMQSRINFKPGFKGKEFYWHSDFETWHVEDGMPRMRAVSCSIILTDNYEYNGPLMLVPGSHRYYISCIGNTPENHYKKSLKKQEFGVPDEESMKWLVEECGGIDTATGPAGSVLFFECNTMHASGGNISPYPRSNVFFVFNSVENQLQAPFSGMEPRPEFLANRKHIQPIEPQAFELKRTVSV